MQNVQRLTAKEVLKVNAEKWPNKVGSKNLYREFTFKIRHVEESSIAM
jgi:hypothetical protein